MLEDFRLKVFVTVAEKGSFTLAAKELGVSQPAVSQNIAELEKSVGSELVRRTRGAVTLTPEGSILIEYARRILHWYNAADNLFATTGKSPSRRSVRVSADSFCSSAIIPQLASSVLATSSPVSFQILPRDASEYDLVLDSHLEGDTLSLEDSANLALTVRPAAIASDPTLAGVNDLSELPEGTRLAVVSKYSKALPLDLKPLVALVADCPDTIIRTVSISQCMVGIVPLPSIPQGLFVLPVDLPGMKVSVHMDASEEFAGTQLFKHLKTVAKNL